MNFFMYAMKSRTDLEWILVTAAFGSQFVAMAFTGSQTGSALNGLVVDRAIVNTAFVSLVRSYQLHH